MNMKISTRKGEIELRQATPADIETIRQMRKAGQFEREAIMFSESQSAFVAAHNGKIIGFCSVGLHPEHKEAGLGLGIEVLKEFRKAGVGSRLREASEKFLVGKGANRLLIDAVNRRSLRFHKKRGFKVTGAPEGSRTPMAKRLQRRI